MNHPRNRVGSGLVAAVATAAVAASTTAAPAEAATRPSVSISTTKARIGAAVFVKASLTPRAADRVFILQRKVGSTWVEVDRDAPSRSSAVRLQVPTVPGKASLRVVAAIENPTDGTIVSVTGTSRTLALRVPSGKGTADTVPSSSADGPFDHDLSGDGRYVVSTENSEDDPDATVRLWDRRTGVSTIVGDGTGYFQDVDISADGSSVGYAVAFSAPVVYDVRTGTRTSPPGVPATAESSSPRLSADGRIAVFTTSPDNDPDSRSRVVVWDRVAGTTTDVPGTDVPKVTAGWDPIVSGDGTKVFANSSYIPPVLFDRTTQTTSALPPGITRVADTSADGRLAVVGDLPLGSEPAHTRLLLDRATGSLTEVRLTGAYRSWKVLDVTDITENGRYLSITATRKGRSSVFRYDRATKKTLRVSLTYRGRSLSRSAGYGVTSESGAYTTFATAAKGTTGTTNRYGSRNVYLRFNR